MKIKNYAILLCGLLISACSGTSLVGEASSSDDQDQVTFTVSAAHESVDNIVTSDGTIINLTTAELHWGEISLMTEGDDEDCTTANVEDIDLDYTENLLDTADEPVVIGTAMVGHFEYCQYAVVFSSEDHSVVLEGTWQTDLDSGAFSITVTGDIVIEAAFQAIEDGEAVDHALHAHGDETEIEATFNNDVATWFEGVDFTASSNDINEVIAANIEAGFSQVLGEE